MLDDVLLEGSISDLVTFPSLIYLSLYNVIGLKPHLNAPSLITYHEGGKTIHETFSAPLPSLILYGVYNLHAYGSHLAEWHIQFPNISRLSLRAEHNVLFSWFESLANEPHSLPALQEISVGVTDGTAIPENIQATMKRLVQARSKSCGIDVALYFEAWTFIRIPIFFGAVSGLFNK
jgi:hypothetical protein